MANRLSLLSALAVAVPIIVVLLAVLAWMRSTASTPATSANIPSAAASAIQPSNRPSAASPANGVAPAPVTAKAPPAPRPGGPLAPDFTGGGAWVNSQPLKLADLKGKVVLVDFWTYGCYNCTNTLPYLKQWWDSYKDQGLVIVGVHTPEFASERVLENVQQAVQSSGIGWPVVQDNDKQIWQAYGNHYWPHFYLVDDRGQIIYDHIGEGAYDETERQIAAALAAAKAE
jgi:thiol-disulfide isomerase/thioredoxin